MINQNLAIAFCQAGSWNFDLFSLAKHDLLGVEEQTVEDKIT
jgi:hypothetical protein